MGLKIDILDKKPKDDQARDSEAGDDEGLGSNSPLLFSFLTIEQEREADQ